jgi:hypothetical protein
MAMYARSADAATSGLAATSIPSYVLDYGEFKP